jgi:hypothetical protein
MQQLFNQFLNNAGQAGANTATDDEVARKREEEMTARRLQQAQAQQVPQAPQAPPIAPPSETFKPATIGAPDEAMTFMGKLERLKQGEPLVGDKDKFAAYLTTSAYDAAKKADRDPLEVANAWYNEISPARRFLMDFARGFMLDRSPQPLETVREELLRKAMMQQSVAQKRKDSSVAALQNLITLEARADLQQDRLNNQLTRDEFRAGVGRVQQQYQVNAVDARAIAEMDLKAGQFNAIWQQRENQQAHEEDVDKWADDRARTRLEQTERLVQVAESKAKAVQAAGGSTVYKPATEEGADLTSIFEMHKPGSGNKFTHANMRHVSQLLADQYDGATQQLARATSEEEIGEANQNLDEVKYTIQTQLDNLMTADMTATERDSRNFRFKFTRDMNRAQGILDVLANDPDVKGRTSGYVTAKWEDIKRKYTGNNADPELARAFVLLETNFVNFRKELSGAAFGELESAGYKAITPSVDKGVLLNSVLTGELTRGAVEQTMQEIKRLNPRALQYYVGEYEDERKGFNRTSQRPMKTKYIQIDGVKYSVDEPWVKELLDQEGF